MSDNGSPFVVWMPGVLTLFGRTLEELRIRHIRTQVNSPWTNGKIERFWGVLQSELLDREVFRTLEAAADGLTRFAAYYNYDRLHGELDWHTPAERYDGTPFTARGLRARAGARPPAGLARGTDAGLTTCLTNPGNYT